MSQQMILPGLPSAISLISQCRPDVIFGEQVASPDGLAWLDIISSDLEAAHYACGAVDTCAAGFGAPHIRQRLYWVADADGEQLHRSWFRKSGGRAEFADGGGVIGLADKWVTGLMGMCPGCDEEGDKIYEELVA